MGVTGNGDELDQLGKIFTVLGTPTKEDWPHVGELAAYVEFTETKPIAWTDLDCFRSFPDETVELLSKLLVGCPRLLPSFLFPF